MALGEITIFAGTLNRRIWIQKPVATQDEFGGQPDPSQPTAWQNVMQLWAAIEPLGGRELAQAAQIYPESNTRFTIRGYPHGTGTPEISPEMRIVDQYGTLYDITNISDIELRHKRIEILAIQRPAGRGV